MSEMNHQFKSIEGRSFTKCSDLKKRRDFHKTQIIKNEPVFLI